jgi:hypothetical protein
MKIEIIWNELEGDWWFDLGISYQKTPYHPEYKRVIAFSFIIFSIYIRK